MDYGDPPSEPDRYCYDPGDPTPSIGGPALLSRRPVVNNAPVERRADVLTYTSAPLDEPAEAIGPVRVCLYVRSSLERFDVFARVCDVDRSGVSRNVCDALERVAPERSSPDSQRTYRVEFALRPTAHRFGRGHRVRLQVSSGAHPRYARNTGTGEPLGTATRLLVADQEVFHDPKYRSELVLSVVAG
ncbi:MAG TPA: CocE/NonD family hydrolase [Streptosporangiaceae bacterium]|nr:CocE/NonD family hydrolase [Streptosporangiaceae bacterium]